MHNIENVTTIKTKIKRVSELRAARNRYALALRRFLLSPTKANSDAVDRAQARLQEVEDAYREGGRLMLEKASDR